MGLFQGANVKTIPLLKRLILPLRTGLSHSNNEIFHRAHMALR